MALVTYKDFCIDALDAERIGRFWGEVLGLELAMQDSGDAYLTGPTPQHRILDQSGARGQDGEASDAP